MQRLGWTLEIDGSPAPEKLVEAVQAIEVEDHADLADMLRLRIAIGRGTGGAGWDVLDGGPFTRLAKVKVSVIAGTAPPDPLIEAHVIEVAAELAPDPAESVATIVAMDPTVLLHLEEKVKPWPNMADSDIASAIFGDHGLRADVESTQPSRDEAVHLTVQRGTDMQLLKQLAERNGFECFVELDAASGSAVGHFHAPRITTAPQGVLSVALGEATNVEAFRPRYDMLRAVTAEVTGLDARDASDQPVQVQAPSLRDLGDRPAAPADRPRKVLLVGTGLAEGGELKTLAQAVVDRSSFALGAEGELDGLAYGGALRAKRPVLVRGAGQAFSGTWYVERVLHRLTREGYVQRFTLRRNALGLSGQEDFAA